MAERNRSGVSRGFKIGDHPVSRSLFGLRRAQIVGAGVSVVLGFSILFSRGGPGGVIGMAVIVGIGCLAFLVGYKRQTLDYVLLAAWSWIAEMVPQRQAGYSYSLFGEPAPKCAAPHLIIPENYGFARIAPKARSMKRRGLLRNTNVCQEVVAGGQNYGVVSDGKNVIFAFELFGENFLYQNRDDQISNAASFGVAIGAMPTTSESISSITLVFTIEPGIQSEEHNEIAVEWSADVKDLLDFTVARQIRRRSFLIIRSHGDAPAEGLHERISSLIEAQPIKSLPLDSKSLESLLTFGTDSRIGSGSLKMKSCWNEISFDNRIVKLFDVVELPKGEVHPDFLVPFLGSLSYPALLSFQFQHVDSRYALRKVRSKRSQVTADVGLRSLFGFLARNSEAKAIENLEIQESELDMGYEMFSVVSTFALFASGRSQLHAAIGDATSRAEKSGLTIECAYGRQLQCWRQLFGGER